MKFDSNCWPKHVSTVCWYIESITVHKVCYTHPLKSFSTLPQSSNAPCSANCFSSVPSITPCAYWCVMHPYILCLYPLPNIFAHHFPKGLRAESARAVTGRQCPHSGVGQNFLTHQPFFLFTKMAFSRKRKSEKSIRRCEINRLAEGFKRAINKIRGPIAKNGFSGWNLKILGQNNVHFMIDTMI